MSIMLCPRMHGCQGRAQQAGGHCSHQGPNSQRGHRAPRGDTPLPRRGGECLLSTFQTHRCSR